MTEFNIFFDIIENIWDVIETSHNNNLGISLKLLYNRLKTPQSYIVFTGETSSGKSTIINSWLEKKFLPAKAKPTTGTVTQITIDSSNTKDEYFAINRDATIEHISEKTFLELSETPDKDLLRLKAKIKHQFGKFEGINAFDTPGFNSIISEHEEVLKEFLPESDVVVFIVNYRVGFGANDQALMDLIFDISEKYSEMPVFLVINRCPEGVNKEDRRVKEILLNAEDTLHRHNNLFLINSSLPDANGVSTLPDSTDLWNNILNTANSEERFKAIFYKSRNIVNNLIDVRRKEAEDIISSMSIKNEEEIQELRKIISEYKDAQKQSDVIILKYMDRLKRELPRITSKQIEILKKEIESEVNSSNKWVDSNTCTTFLASHFIPFGIKKTTKILEEYILSEIEQMDKELSELANKTIISISDTAQQVNSPELSNLIKNIAWRLSNKLAGNYASSLINSYGGVGGTAAGLGNLAKTGLKRIGNLFGKTFSRDVYTNIGKFFTKKMLFKLTIALQIFIEVASIVWDANVWKSKLIKQANQAIDNWLEETNLEIVNTMIPEYTNHNKEIVNQIYNESILEIENNIIDIKKGFSKEAKVLNLGYLSILNNSQKKLNEVIYEQK